MTKNWKIYTLSKQRSAKGDAGFIVEDAGCKTQVAASDLVAWWLRLRKVCRPHLHHVVLRDHWPRKVRRATKLFSLIMAFIIFDYSSPVKYKNRNPISSAMKNALSFNVSGGKS